MPDNDLHHEFEELTAIHLNTCMIVMQITGYLCDLRKMLTQISEALGLDPADQAD